MLRGTRWSGVAILLAVSSVGAWHLADAAEPQIGTAKAKKQAAAELKEKSETALREVIGREAVGDLAERNSSLDALIEQNPNFALARWQRGFVRTAEGWRPVDELTKPNSESSQEIAYRKLREKTPEGLAGNLLLASWCKKHGLKEAARGHWLRTLLFDANSEEAHLGLDHTRVNGAWQAPEDIAEAKARAVATRNAVKNHWQNISQSAEAYANGPEDKKQLCESKLREIRDPAAMPLLSLALVPKGDESALLLVDLLKSVPVLEATHALSDVGVRTDSDAVRKAVIEELKTRDEHAVIPPLLLAMSTPVTSEMKLTLSDDGALMYGHVFSRENQVQKQLRIENTRFSTSSAVITQEDLYFELARGPRRYRYDPVLGVERMLSAYAGAVARDAAEVTRQNMTIQEVNDRVGTLLTQITGANNSEPEDWWQWWNDRQQVQVTGGKQVHVSDGYQDIVASNLRRLLSCFVKGTPVWTSRGKVAIETLRTGDLVLSQDLKTGELAFKAVIRPTRRPSTAIYELEIGNSKLQCTAGHPFWVPGSGWTKAIDLKPGMLIRCVDGSRPVLSTSQVGEAETHNLIVDGFQSYFVGEEKTLCHDNTEQQPTLAIAPGVYREGEAPLTVRRQ
jgi:hypothetical protein